MDLGNYSMKIRVSRSRCGMKVVQIARKMSIALESIVFYRMLIMMVIDQAFWIPCFDEQRFELQYRLYSFNTMCNLQSGCLKSSCLCEAWFPGM